MREGVTYKRLGDVATYVNGYAFKPETWTDHGLPIVRIQNLNKPDAEYNYYAGELPAKFIIEDGDLLISWSASLGAYIWKGGKAYLNQHIFKVVFGKSDIDKSYLKYAVESKLLEMKRNVHGSTMQHIVKGDFDNTKIPVPSLDEQQRIVSELDRLASIISDKQQQLHELDNLAQAIFYEMFGDPLTNPKGWETKAFADMCEDLFAGGDVPKDDVCDHRDELHPYPIYSNGIKDDGLYGYTSKCRVYHPAITISARGTIGATFVRKEPFFPVVRLISAIPCKNVDIIYFAECVKKIDVVSNGNSIPQLTVPMLKAYSLPCPPLDLQKQFAEKVKAIEAQKDVLRQSIAEFENLLGQRMELHFA